MYRCITPKAGVDQGFWERHFSCGLLGLLLTLYIRGKVMQKSRGESIWALCHPVKSMVAKDLKKAQRKKRKKVLPRHSEPWPSAMQRSSKGWCSKAAWKEYTWGTGSQGWTRSEIRTHQWLTQWTAGCNCERDHPQLGTLKHKESSRVHQTFEASGDLRLLKAATEPKPSSTGWLDWHHRILQQSDIGEFAFVWEINFTYFSL